MVVGQNGRNGQTVPWRAGLLVVVRVIIQPRSTSASTVREILMSRWGVQITHVIVSIKEAILIRLSCWRKFWSIHCQTAYQLSPTRQRWSKKYYGYMFYEHVLSMLTLMVSFVFRQYSIGLTAKPVDVRNPSALGNQQDLSSGAYRWAAVVGYYILLCLIILAKPMIVSCIKMLFQTPKYSKVDVIQEISSSVFWDSHKIWTSSSWGSGIH